MGLDRANNSKMFLPSSIAKALQKTQWNIYKFLGEPFKSHAIGFLGEPFKPSKGFLWIPREITRDFKGSLGFPMGFKTASQ